MQDALFCFRMRASSLLCLGWAPWVIPCYVFPGSLSWSGVVVILCFRHEFGGEGSGPSLAPRFAGFTVPAQPTRDNRNGRLLYPVWPVRYSLVHFGCASSAMQAVPLLPQGITGRSYRRPLSPFSSGCRGHGVLTLGHGMVCFVSFELGSLVLPLRLFFVKNFAVILVGARESGSRSLPC